jgi:ABC-type proline/glycine betaine transport system substrate-binding protein
MQKAKTHTLIVRGIPKKHKNALKRMAKTFTPTKISVNALMLMMIASQTKAERVASDFTTEIED